MPIYLRTSETDQVKQNSAINQLVDSVLKSRIAIGSARMYPAASQSSSDPWICRDPFGNDIVTTGTTTQGLQEVLTAAQTNNWNVWIQGRGTITCSTAVTVPTNANRTMLVDAGIAINFAALGSASLMTFDSHENADVRFYGQVVQNAADTGVCIALKGTTTSPFGNKGFFASYLEFASVAPGSGGAGISMDCTSGGFIGNRVIIRDINGGTIGVKVINPGTAFIAFEHNQVQNFYSHSQSGTLLQIGQNSTNQSNIRQNLWSLGRVDPAGASAIVVDTWGSNDTFFCPFIPNEGAALSVGIKIESGADGNNIIGGIVAGTTPISDSGTNTTILGVKGATNQMPGGIGFSAGAGGTVTQSTSKATGVTLNKATGSITLNAASLAAGTIVSFALTNSVIGANDLIAVQHESGGTTGAYTVNGRATGTGTAAIDVRNNTAGALAEAIVLRFAVIRSSNS